jgi:hypothetical protein
MSKTTKKVKAETEVAERYSEVVDSGMIGDFEFEVIRINRTREDGSDGSFFTTKLFRTFVSKEFGKKRDYAVPTWLQDAYLAATEELFEIAANVEASATTKVVSKATGRKNTTRTKGNGAASARLY